jgi:hypothetical protein
MPLFSTRLLMLLFAAVRVVVPVYDVGDPEVPRVILLLFPFIAPVNVALPAPETVRFPFSALVEPAVNVIPLAMLIGAAVPNASGSARVMLAVALPIETPDAPSVSVLLVSPAAPIVTAAPGEMTDSPSQDVLPPSVNVVAAVKPVPESNCAMSAAPGGAGFEPVRFAHAPGEFSVVRFPSVAQILSNVSARATPAVPAIAPANAVAAEIATSAF